MLVLLIGNALALKMAIENWNFCETGTNVWHKAKVPSTVHLDLLDNGLIEDPYIDDNIDKMDALEFKNWTYTTKFDVQKGYDQSRLVFEGLDTHVDVYLNGILVLKADNQHRVWILNLLNFLEKDNNLTLNFHSASLHDSAAAKAATVPLPSDYAYSRKAAYHYGWDWGPRIVTCGIWKPVYLEQMNFGAIRNIHLRTLKIVESVAKVEISVKVQFFRTYNYQMFLTIDNQTQIVNHSNINKFSRKTFRFEFTIENVQLWWPAGQGSQYLYDIIVQLKISGLAFASSSIRSGIRIAEWSDDIHLTLNGRDIYVKGANYIPPDMFMPRMLRNPQKYEQIFQDALNAGYNGLRVWGGGQFEYDIFYDLADKYGILIWHDFMFACAMYPSSVFSSVTEEIKNNVIRLRTHPSIVLWNGNNEIKQGWLEWGYNSGSLEQTKIKKDWYDQLFTKLIPGLLKLLDPDTFYLPSSPSVMMTADVLNGDIHYWGVWAQEADLETYRERIGAFNSEYGMQAIPEMSSIKKFIKKPADWSMNSVIFQKHEKHSRGICLLNLYIDTYTKPTQNFFYKAYNSQVVQHLALEIGIHALRAAKPFNMGSFYWQMNDVWPVTSWSTVDYYGCYKAGHYAAKQAHAQVILLVKYNTTLQVFANSDLFTPVDIQVDLKHMNFNGSIEYQFKNTQRTIKGGSNDMIFEDVNISLFNTSKTSHYLHLNLKYNNISVDSSYVFARPKDLLLQDPQISMTLNSDTIILRANKYAKYVYLYTDDDCLVLDDNYFDLYPGIPKVLNNTKHYTNNVRVMSFFDVQ